MTLMKNILSISIILLTFVESSCKSKETGPDADLPSSNVQEIDTVKLLKAQQAIETHIKSQAYHDSSSYESLKWGELQVVNALNFKYKISHQFKIQYKDSAQLNSFDMTYHLDSIFTPQISGIETSIYSKYFDETGLPFQNFENREFQETAILNGLEMFIYLNDKNRLLISGGGKELALNKTIGVSKQEWLKSLAGVDLNLLAETDTVEYDKYGVYAFSHGGGFRYYIFSGDTLSQFIESDYSISDTQTLNNY